MKIQNKVIIYIFFYGEGDKCKIQIIGTGHHKNAITIELLFEF